MPRPGFRFGWKQRLVRTKSLENQRFSRCFCRRTRFETRQNASYKTSRRRCFGFLARTLCESGRRKIDSFCRNEIARRSLANVQIVPRKTLAKGRFSSERIARKIVLVFGFAFPRRYFQRHGKAIGK
ncbi:hypothetical protein D3C87_520350 [compost metagenome]